MQKHACLYSAWMQALQCLECMNAQESVVLKFLERMND